MRSLLVPIATLALALSAAAQTFDHVRLEGVTNGHALAEELELAGYTVVEGGTLAGSIELHATAGEQATLANAGYELTMITVSRPFQEIQNEIFAANPEMVPTGYPTVADIIAQMAATEAAYPAIAKLVDVTATYGTPMTHDGNAMYALKISDNVDQDEDEPAVMILCGQHANEIGTGVVGLHALDVLTKKYATDPAIQAMVDGNEIWIAPTWNPDGLDYVHFVSTNWRKNRRDNGNGSFGVDLNRNWGAGWTAGCSGSTSTSSGNYKGPSAFSEPETAALKALSDDQRFVKQLEFHSSGRETLWEFNCTVHPWAAFMQQYAIQISMAGGYGNAERPPSAEGEYYEWEFTKGNVSHLTEISNSQQPSYASAQLEARQLFNAVQWLIEDPFLLSGHVTDACTGAGLAASISFQGVTLPFGGGFSSGGAYGRYDLIPPAGTYTVEFSAPGYLTQSFPGTVVSGTPVVLDVALAPSGTSAVTYCTAGTTASGCTASISGTGTASASSATGFDVDVVDVEASKNGILYFGTNGRQGNPWGNGTSLQCVQPPVQRMGLLFGTGTGGTCEGSYAMDFNTWMAANPTKAPASGETVQVQCWFRDPASTSNQTTSLSDALEFGVCP